MTHLADRLNGQQILALEPEELGLEMLPSIHIQAGGSGINVLQYVGTTCGSQGVNFPGVQATVLSEAIREAWHWLAGQGLLIPSLHYRMPHDLMVLSRKARTLLDEGARRPRGSSKLLKEMLHPAIRETVWTQFQRGHYDTAVFEAMKAVEIAVREAGRFGNGQIGTALMAEAFKPGGPLADTGQEKGEQVARMKLFEGAIGSFKNPHSHRRVALTDPDEAVEMLSLASMLLRIVASSGPQS